MGLSQIEVRFLETMISCARSIAKSLETLAENDTKRLKMEQEKRGVTAKCITEYGIEY